MIGRVTKCICPSCKGSLRGILGVCQWCRGDGRLAKLAALRWAQQSFVLGSGGYICGDHSYEDGEKMKDEANAVRKIFGLEPLRVGA